MVVLIGAPGAGKTSLGAQLAAELEVEFADTDALVESATGRSIAELFIEEGEPYFREQERQAVLGALGSHTGVLALGGGAVMNPEIASELRGHRVVWLQVGLGAAAPRIGLSGPRPLLLGNPRQQWTRLLNEREPVYAELSQFQVATDSLSVEALSRQIREWLQA